MIGQEFDQFRFKIDQQNVELETIYMILHFDHVFSTFVKSGFQNPTVLRDVSPYTSPGKVIIFLTDRRRTDTRYTWF